MKKPSSETAPPHLNAIEIPLELLNRNTVTQEHEPIEISPLQLHDATSLPDLEISDDVDVLPLRDELAFSGWFRWGGLTVLALSFLEAGNFLYHQYLVSPWLGGAWSVACGALLIGVLGMGVRQLRALRHLRRNTRLREEAERLRSVNQHGNALAFCRNLASENKLQNLPGYQAWLEHIEPHHDDSEVLTLFSQFVLHPLDEKALQLVLKSSSQTALLVAASPLALADMLLVLWRNLKMLQDIADIYQIRLGYWGRLRLIRQIVQNMVFAGATELVTELGTDWFSSELTSKLSAKLAQGLGSGLMSARLGINAIQLCRPIQLLPGEKPKLSQIRRALLKRLSSTVSQFFTSKVPGDPQKSASQKE